MGKEPSGDQVRFQNCLKKRSAQESNSYSFKVISERRGGKGISKDGREEGRKYKAVGKVSGMRR